MSRLRPTVFSHLAEGIDCLRSVLYPVPEIYMGFFYFAATTARLWTLEQLSNSRPKGLKFCMAMASAILADISRPMCFSHDLIFSDSTQTQSAALASMTHPAFKLRWIKPANLEQMRSLFLNTLRFLSTRLERTSKKLQSLDVSMKW